MYGILAVVGWIWTAVVLVYLFVKLRRKEPKGFEVLDHEKQL
jgi:hypothetical protein